MTFAGQGMVQSFPVAVVEGSVPMKKRKQEEFENEFAKRSKLDMDESSKEEAPKKKEPMSRARALRLEQNRKAARESRRRKKVMIEELQRSLVFFSRANGALKQQNEELSRLLQDAQNKVTTMTSGSEAETAMKKESAAEPVAENANSAGTAPATAAPAQFPLASTFPTMQPGSTMQAMANFQQAVASAMKAAVKGMEGNFSAPVGLSE